jgi:hypothetical protein
MTALILVPTAVLLLLIVGITITIFHLRVDPPTPEQWAFQQALDRISRQIGRTLVPAFEQLAEATTRTAAAMAEWYAVWRESCP